MPTENPILRRSQPMPAMENPFTRFGLRENPFPTSPTVTPQSSDPRVNGDIYCTELRAVEEDQFEQLLIPRAGQAASRPIALLMDYATRRGRGIGKTAFLNRQRRRIMLDLGDRLTDGAYVMLAAHVIPEGGGRTRKFWQFVRSVALSLNSQYCISTAIWRLRAFSGLIEDNVLGQVTLENMGSTLGDDRWLQEHNVDVLFTLNHEVERMLVRAGVREDVARSLSVDGASPEAWEQRFLRHQSDPWWRTEGHLLIFDDLVRLFQAADISRVLLLVDEVEKIVRPQNSQERRAFVDDLRRFFVDGPYQNIYTHMYGLLLTIHPYVQELWQPYWKAAGLDRVCPLGGGAASQYTIYFYPFKAEDAAVPLVKAYLDYFRIKDGDRGSLEPFDEEAVVRSLDLEGGLPGPMLNLLRLAMDEAIKEGWQTIHADQIESIFGANPPSEPEDEAVLDNLPAVKVDLTGNE